MQEKKEGTKPVRIREGLLCEVEKLAIKESERRERLVSIPEMVAELLEDGLERRLQN